MTITISPDVERVARERAAEEGIGLEAYIAQLILNDELGELDLSPMDENHPDFEEVRAAVMEGLEQADRGEGVSAEEVFAEIRAKRGWALNSPSEPVS